MSRFLFTTLPSNDLGLLTRSLPIADELAQRGHEVLFCSPAVAPSTLIAQAGFPNLLPRHPVYHLMAAELSGRGLYRLLRSERLKQDFGNLFGFARQLVRCIPTRLAPGASEIWSVDHLAALSGMLSERFVRSSCDALLELIVASGADGVVDFWNPFACVAARVAQKPLATVIQADMHPHSRGFMWWKEPPSDAPTPVPVLNRVLAKYGLSAVRKTEELCVGDLTLVVGMPETDPLPETAQVTYIGPLLWQKAQARLPDWIDDLSQAKPLIWVYSGNPRYMPGVSSWVDSAVVVHACIAALADRDVQVVLTTGHHALPKGVLPLPDNFRYAPYLPGLAMAARSDVLIHHGGYGSCQTGLYAGTPAVIIPTYSERESNARRIAAAGAGEYVLPVDATAKKRRVPPEELWARVRQVLSEPSYATNARRLGAELRAYGGAPQAASLIEAFVLREHGSQRAQKELCALRLLRQGVRLGKRQAVRLAVPPRRP
jgi:UDP:flavonoid glycosyltransferase YjiC (YdhE family)